MNKEEKINLIKLWLQKFGYRDNEGFWYEINVDGKNLHLGLQYNYDDNDGAELDPYCWCNNSFKLVAQYISEFNEDELDVIYKELLKIKSHY